MRFRGRELEGFKNDNRVKYKNVLILIKKTLTGKFTVKLVFEGNGELHVKKPGTNSLKRWDTHTEAADAARKIIDYTLQIAENKMKKQAEQAANENPTDVLEQK